MAKKTYRVKGLVKVALEVHDLPDFTEVRGKDWIRMGEDNLYPDFLIRLFNRSPKHNAIVTGKSSYIFGGGFVSDTEDANLKYFLENINSQETANEVLKKTILDKELFGGFYLEIIWDKSRNKIAEINHLEFSKMRSNSDNTAFYYSEDWTARIQSEEKTGLKYFKSFDVNEKDGSSVFFYREYRPGLNTYCHPNYIGAIQYIEVDCEISNFHLNAIKNGFVAGTMLNFATGVPEPEEQEEIEDRVKDKFTGTDNANSLVISFSNGKDTSPEVISLRPNDFDKQFDTLNKTCQQEIFTGHKITSGVLFGIKTEGQLGNRTEMIEAFELLKANYVRPAQELFTKIFSEFAKINGVTTDFEIKELPPITEQLSESSLMQILDKNELREKAGYEPIQEIATSQASIKQEMSMSSQVEVFSKYGKPKKDYLIIKSKTLRFSSDKEIELSELDFSFEDLTGLQKQIVIAIGNNPDFTIKELSEILDKDVKSIEKNIKSLIDSENLSVNKDGEYKLPLDIRKLIPKNNKPTETIGVMYSYEVKDGLGPAILPLDKDGNERTRDFCRELITLDKLYTRDEINKMSSEVGYNVWEKRGGWYTNPKNDVSTPSCRHVWKQNIVRKK